MIIRRIVGDSMGPTLKEGQIVIGIKSQDYKTGQIVIAKQAGKEVIKSLSKVDGDNYYLLGDNKSKSSDSRKYGPIKKSDILAKLIYPFRLN